MSHLRLAGVTFAYPQQDRLIEACTLDFAPRWTAIVGHNGAGKSTLLDLIDGTIAPTDGRVDAAGLRIRRCHQSLTTSEEVADFANAWTSSAMRWMSLLELDPGDFWRWNELSPGMRRRWQIGAALHDDPGILLLDEPTNHLDVEGRLILLEALRQFDGIGVVVSHDRAFLDELCSATARIQRGGVTLYSGGYSTARRAWEAEAAAALERLESAQTDVRGLEAELTQRAAQHASSARLLSAAARMSGPRDSDARGILAQGRAEKAEAKHARNKGVTRAKLERARAGLNDLERPDARARSVFLDGEPCPRPFVLDWDGQLEIEERVLAESSRLIVPRDGRVRLVGPNGCGKTTLIRAALAQCDLPAERVLVIEQHLREPVVRARFEALAADERQRALYVGSALLLDARAVLHHEPLSAGEVRKLAVAVGFVHQPWLLVLDEPTNDLDVESIERLEDALLEYDGALVLVTHDDYFAKRLATETLVFPGIERAPKPP